MAEIRQGGASYVATGRGLPTDRREFVGAPSYTLFRLSIFVQNLDLNRVQSCTVLRASVMKAVKAAVTSTAGEDKVRPEGVVVDFAERGGKIAVEIRPTPGTATIPMKAKLCSDAMGGQVVSNLEEVPGMEQACLGPLFANSYLQNAVAG